MRRFLLFFLLLATVPPLYAVVAYPHAVRCLQPDGSTVTLYLYGDERFHYYTTASGLPVCQGLDGFYYVADLSTSGMKPSAQRIGKWSGAGVLAQIFEEDPSLMLLRQTAWERWKQANPFPSRAAFPNRQGDQPIRVLVIPVQFRDVSFHMDDPRIHFDHLLNGQHDFQQSAKTYFQDNLGEGQIVEFDVVDPLTLPRSRSYYGSNDEYGSDVNAAGMVEEACRILAKNSFDFSQYDLNGDQEVDYLFIYYAGENEAESAQSEAVWPHAGNIRDRELSFLGTSIGPYACTSELKGVGEEGAYAGIGTFCHEFAHLLGLVDLYDTDGSVSGEYRSIWGPVALMNHGAYNNGGNTPPYLCAVDLELLGLLEYLPSRVGDRVELTPVWKDRQALKIETGNPGEYFLIEMRSPYTWDEYIGGMGLLVYHVDKSDRPADGILANLRWMINKVNGSSKHPCVDLVSAGTDLLDLSALFYPGSQHAFSLTTATRPPLVSWQGQGCGVGLDSIRIAMNRDFVSFVLISDLGNALPKVLRHTATIGQQDILLRWTPDLQLDVQWQLEWRSVTEPVFHTVTTTQTEYRISGLAPNEIYLIRITPRTESLLGETYQLDLRTSEVTAPFPAIAGMDKTYYVGDILPLKVHNLAEPVRQIRWLLNGRQVSVQELMLIEPGPMEILAEITYVSDGAKEYIYKVVHVQPQKEEGTAYE